MYRTEQSIKNPVRKFNNEIAGHPINKADTLWANLNTKLVEQGKALTAENIRQSMRLVRNIAAEEIANGKIQTITFIEILKKITPTKVDNQELTEEEKIVWRKQKLANITKETVLTNNQKQMLIFEGVKYFPDGTVDLSPFAYKNIIIPAQNNQFCIFKGKPDKKADRKYGERIMENMSLNKPENVHFHHQIADNIQQLVLVAKLLHDILPHVGWSRYERIENLHSSTKLKTK
jgi:phage pi2 protein 07